VLSAKRPARVTHVTPRRPIRAAGAAFVGT
jgi:hypothetical protein